MAIHARDVIPTRSVLLELADEHRFTREGHQFLDQKRMLVAGELLRALARYEACLHAWLRHHGPACGALAAATAMHGLDALSVHPAGTTTLEQTRIKTINFLGVLLAQPGGATTQRSPPKGAVDTSPEVRRTAAAYALLMAEAVELAACAGNVVRLLNEYRKTERRARALENVILPELATTMAHVEEQLEEQDQEEAARLRLRRANP